MNQTNQPQTEPTGTGVQLVVPLEQRSANDTSGEPADVDSLLAENRELRERLRMNEARETIIAGLTAAGAGSPELLFAAAKDQLEFGDDGRLANAEAVIGRLKESFPEQFGSPRPVSIDGGAGSRNASATLTRDALAKMKPDEIARLDWAVVKEALKQ
jgi:hypothetical protein